MAFHRVAVAQVVRLVDRRVEPVVELLGLAVDHVDRGEDKSPWLVFTVAVE